MVISVVRMTVVLMLTMLFEAARDGRPGLAG